jgi:hypothetical protein
MTETRPVYHADLAALNAERRRELTTAALNDAGAAEAGLLRLVLSWAGAWNPRLVRGGTTLSRHAYAVGWDINAAWNPLGKAPAPAGSTGSVVELVPLAVEHGYTNGMNWSRPDPMHFEVCRVM